MSNDNITPIRPDVIPPSPPIDFAAAVRTVLDTQLPKMGEAMAVVSTCKAAIRSVYDCDDAANPQIDGALGAVYRLLDGVFYAFLELEGKLEKIEAGGGGT